MGIMENTTETIIQGLGFRALGFRSMLVVE